MSKFLISIKRLIIFILLAIIVAIINVTVNIHFFAFVGDEELLTLIEKHQAPLIFNLFQKSLYAFALTYICAKQIINKKTSKILFRLLYDTLIFLLLFYIIL